MRTMRIGDLSRRTGVAAHLLRYYEKRGLLAPDRGNNGYREYDDGAVITTAQIRGLLEAGLSTEEIGHLLPCATGTAPKLERCSPVLDMLLSRLRVLDDRIGSLDRSRRALRAYVLAAEDAAAESA